MRILARINVARQVILLKYINNYIANEPSDLHYGSNAEQYRALYVD